MPALSHQHAESSSATSLQQERHLQSYCRKPLSLQNRRRFLQHLNEHCRLILPATTFPRFCELPPELRSRIWRAHVLEPRIVDLYYSEGTKRSTDEQQDIVGYAHWTSPLPPPSALSCCRESRIEALEVYKLCFGRPEIRYKWPKHQYRWTIVPRLPPHIYFKRQDILYVHKFTEPAWSTSIAERCKEDIGMVESLAVDIEDWWTASTGYLKVPDHLGYKLQSFSSLKDLTFVLIRSEEDGGRKLFLNQQIQLIDIKTPISKGTKVEGPWNLNKIRAAVEQEVRETQAKFPGWQRPHIQYAQLVGRSTDHA